MTDGGERLAAVLELTSLFRSDALRDLHAQIEAFNNGFMEVIFPADVIRVGFWVTQGSMTLFLKDATNSNLSTGDFQVSGIAGQLIGIQRDAAEILGVTIGFDQAFAIDDCTSSSNVIPEPSTALLLAVGATLLGTRRRGGLTRRGCGAARRGRERSLCLSAHTSDEKSARSQGGS